MSLDELSAWDSFLNSFLFFFFYIFGLLFYFLFIHTLYMLFYTKGFLLFLFFFGSYVIRTQKQALLHTTRFLNKSK